MEKNRKRKIKREKMGGPYVRQFFKQFLIRLIRLKETINKMRKEILNICSTRLAKTAPFVSEL